MHTDTQKLTIHGKRVVMIIPRRIARIKSELVGKSRIYTVTKHDRLDISDDMIEHIHRGQELQDQRNNRICNNLVQKLANSAPHERSMVKVNQYLSLKYHINRAVKIDNV